MSRRRLGLLLIWALAAADLGLAAAAWTRQPWANGPAEWRWQYLAEATSGAPATAAPAPATPAAAALAHPGALAALAVALLVLGAAALSRRIAAWRGALPLAIAAGAVFTLALAAWQPGGFQRVAAALVSRNSFGYLWDASLAPSSRALLADYPAASAGLNQHSLTHPPGPLLAVRSLAWLDRLLPPPTTDDAGRANAADPANIAAAADLTNLPRLAAAAVEHEVVRARRHGRPVPPVPPGAWSTAAFALLLPLLSALAAWPLYRLARRLGGERPTALAAAVLWLLVPARSLFTPSFDQALPLPFLAAACLAAAAAPDIGRPGRRRFPWQAAGAGALLFVCCFLSYGCLPALPLVLVMPLLVRWRSTTAPPDPPTAGARGTAHPRLRTAAAHLLTVDPATWGCLALGFALPYLYLALAFGHNPWLALRAALDLHHEIAVAPRSYTTWLLWNPYDFALLLSPALLALAALSGVAVSAASATSTGPDAPDSPAAPAAAENGAVPATRAALAAVWCGLLALLWLSGNVRGEAGRIWLLWMPFAALLAAAAAARPGAAHRAAFAALLAAQSLLVLALAASMLFVG